MIFVDTNVIVALFREKDPSHNWAVDMMDSAMRRRQYLVVSPQVVGEAFVTVTSKKLFKHPVTAGQFRKQIGDLMSGGGFLMVSPGEKAVEHALRIAEELSVASAHIFDLILYGTMREHGITRIATINVKHFRNLEGIELISPI